MSVGINYVELMGHLGSNPHFAKKNDFSVANATLATGSVYKDKKTGEKVEKTEWHKIVFYGRQAEIVNDYLVKGSKILIKGNLRTRKWEDKTTGEDRYSTEIIAYELHIMGSPKDKSEKNPYKQTEEQQREFNHHIPTSNEDDIPF